MAVHTRSLKQARSDIIAAGFNWNGVLFQTGPDDVRNITGRVGKITAKKALGDPVPDFQWRAADNSMHLFAANDFLRFAIAVDEFVESTYIASWEL